MTNELTERFDSNTNVLPIKYNNMHVEVNR